MTMRRAEFFMLLGLALFTVLLFCGCAKTQSALDDIDRSYDGFYDASSGQGGVKMRWTPADRPGQGKPSVGLEIDFKHVVPPMDFSEVGSGRNR